MNKKISKLLISQLLFVFLFLSASIFSPEVTFAQCAGGQIDLLDYMGPENAENFDLRYCSPNGSGSEPIQVKRDTITTTQGQKSGFFLNKGGNYEAYFYDSSSIYFYEDISWDEKCPGGNEAFYRVFTPNGGPGGKIPRCMDIGGQFSSPQYIIAYDEEGYSHGDTGNICNDGYQATTIQATIELASNTPYAPDIPGSPPEDTIVMQNISGAGAGEYKYYTKGYGLTAFVALDGTGSKFFHSTFFKDGLSTSEPNLSCTGGSGALSGYDSSLYPEYEVDETKSYISPIRRVVDSPTDGSVINSVSGLRSELINQGYQAYCASENVDIAPKYDSAGLIDRYFELYPDGIKNLKVSAVETLDTANAQYPLWRDVSNKQFLMSSLEEYFGFKDVYQDTPSESILNSSPINSLLSEPQLCVQGWLNIVAQKTACQRLARPEECELLTRPIPDTNLNVGSLESKLHAYEPAYQSGVAKKGCTALVNEQNPDHKELYQGLINMPTYFDRAYRYGFIVSVIHTENPSKTKNETQMKIFNFFTQSTVVQHPRDEVLVVAFKLPDIGTNKGGGDEAGSMFWSDPLDLTRKLLTTKQEQIYHEEISRVIGKTPTGHQVFEGTSRGEFRKDLLLKAETKKVQNESSRIYCTDAIEEADGKLPTAHVKSSPACKNYLTKAITDIINGSVESCGDTEAVNIIKDIAGLDNPGEPYGREFNGDNGGLVLQNLFKEDITHRIQPFNDPQHAENKKKNADDPFFKDDNLSFKSFFNLDKPKWDDRAGSHVTADFYLVYPMGFELTAVEDAIKGAFFTRAQLAELEKQKTVDSFNFDGPHLGLSDSADSFSYEDFPKTLAGKCGKNDIIDPITGFKLEGFTNKPCINKVSINIEQDPAGVSILGAKLGFWMKQVQKQLHTRSSSAWSYFNSCTTTEEFMLGRCRGGTSITSSDTRPTSETSGDETYCVDWIGLTPEKANTYKENMRKHLISFEHIDGNQKEKFNTELLSQTHVDWRDNIIPASRVNFYEIWYGGGRALLWTKHPDCKGQVCFDYIMDTCASRGVNPAICVGMTITETGGLNHLRFPDSYDFGCLASKAADIDSGLNCLMDKFFFSETPRDGILVRDMNYSEMWLQFAGKGFGSSSYTTMQKFLEQAGDVGYSNKACETLL